WLFTPFDAAIGHYRRYAKGMLRGVAPAGLPLVRLAYLDAAGMLASLGNRLVLRSAVPTPTQIAVWDRFLVPFSRWIDPLLGYSIGKSVLAVWQKPLGLSGKPKGELHTDAYQVSSVETV